MEEIKSIGLIGNYYGGLLVAKNNGKFYWIIENYDTELQNVDQWDEISEKLYNTLLEEEKAQDYEEI